MVIETGNAQSPFVRRGRAAISPSVLLALRLEKRSLLTVFKKKKTEEEEQINANLRINLGWLTGQNTRGHQKTT